MEMFGYFAAILMGITLGLLGGGGSILTVPILVYLFHVSATDASAYSLFVVGSTALAGAISYGYHHLVDWKTGTIFAIPALIGAYSARRWLVPALPDVVFANSAFAMSKDLLILLSFAILMVLAALSMIRPRRLATATTTALKPFYRWSLTLAEGLGVGLVTGFVGAGGGFLVIPALVVLGKLPMRLAVGTSLFVIAIKSLTGFVGDVESQLIINWHLLIPFTLLAFVGNFVGVQTARYVPEANLKKAFGWFVLFMGIWIIYQELL
ncbi:MAG: sulfite exporter TauE/SafE family protein [Caldilineaceae bacterium]|nr:sulfite exporter TauE/SafE family protein [Caldilineaceae bacterium]